MDNETVWAMEEGTNALRNDPGWRPNLQENEIHTLGSSKFHRMMESAREICQRAAEHCLRYATPEQLDAFMERLGERRRMGRPATLEETAQRTLHKACDDASDFVTMHQRMGWMNDYGFAVVGRDDIKAALDAAGNAPILEIGSGNGYLAHEFHRAGADIAATEPYPPGKGNDWVTRHATIWTEEQPLDAEQAIAEYPNRALLWSYPPKEEWTGLALEKYQGDTVIYIGEPEGHSTGNEMFHTILERDYEQALRRPLPNFSHCYASLTVFRRKKDAG